MKQGYVCIYNNIFPTLLAVSADEQTQGLMFKPWPPPVMAFIYDRPQINKFWMKNTVSPLDIVFCYKNKISQICYGEPYSTSIIGADILSDLVIEFPYGTVEKCGIKLGQVVGLVKSELDKI